MDLLKHADVTLSTPTELKFTQIDLMYKITYFRKYKALKPLLR